jgi:hypothetical protein
LAQSLTLEGYGDLKGLSAGEGLEVTPLPPLGSGMPAVSDAPAVLGWSGTPPAASGFVLQSIDTLPDGCSSLRFSKGSESSLPLYLCAPDWGFPFAVGDQLQVLAQELEPPSSSASASGLQSTGEGPRARHLSISNADDGTKLEIWLNASRPQVTAVGAVLGSGEQGRHTACGAYVESASVEVVALKQALTAGDEREATIAGRRSRAFLGRAEDVLVAPDACGTEYSSFGARFDLLLLDTPVEKSP